jgi:DNA-binding response OmpR family regulator
MVDDDPMVCIAIEFCLQRGGFDVTVAGRGEAGITALKTSTFDVMLINILMPQTSGFGSIESIYERAPAIPLVAMFGCAFTTREWPSPEFLRMTLELGAKCCLRKPFTPNALLAAVNLCLTRPALVAQLSR